MIVLPAERVPVIDVALTVVPIAGTDVKCIIITFVGFALFIVRLYVVLVRARTRRRLGHLWKADVPSARIGPPRPRMMTFMSPVTLSARQLSSAARSIGAFILLSSSLLAIRTHTSVVLLRVPAAAASSAATARPTAVVALTRAVPGAHVLLPWTVPAIVGVATSMAVFLVTALVTPNLRLNSNRALDAVGVDLRAMCSTPVPQNDGCSSGMIVWNGARISLKGLTSTAVAHGGITEILLFVH